MTIIISYYKPQYNCQIKKIGCNLHDGMKAQQTTIQQLGFKNTNPFSRLKVQHDQYFKNMTSIRTYCNPKIGYIHFWMSLISEVVCFV